MSEIAQTDLPEAFKARLLREHHFRMMRRYPEPAMQTSAYAIFYACRDRNLADDKRIVERLTGGRT